MQWWLFIAFFFHQCSQSLQEQFLPQTIDIFPVLSSKMISNSWGTWENTSKEHFSAELHSYHNDCPRHYFKQCPHFFLSRCPWILWERVCFWESTTWTYIYIVRPKWNVFKKSFEKSRLQPWIRSGSGIVSRNRKEPKFTSDDKLRMT